MTEFNFEIFALLASVALGLIQLFLPVSIKSKLYGTKWNLSSRDQKMPEPPAICGRLERGHKNFLETYTYFVALLLLVIILNKESYISTLGALLYLAGRAVYILCYAFDWTGWRTLFWLCSLVGIFLIATSIFI